jgi:hypothetical protein
VKEVNQQSSELVKVLDWHVQLPLKSNRSEFLNGKVAHFTPGSNGLRVTEPGFGN